jgi:hypothetical protein
MNWNADFAGLPPINLPDGRRLETLACLRQYILELPEADQPRWEIAAAQLLQAAEFGGPFRFIACVSFARALHGVEGVGPRPERRDEGADWRAKRANRKRMSEL